MRIDICCVARNENLTICDWVKYHLDMGFNHIWIFDNNDEGDFSLDATLKNGGLLNDKVTILTEFKGCTNFQLVAYNYFVCKYRDRDLYDWVGFIDCDEYYDYDRSTFKKFDHIFDIIDNNKGLNGRCGVLYINWEVYNSCGQYYYEDKPVVERFPTPNPKKIPFSNGDDENVHIKSFVKKGVNGTFFNNPHSFFPFNDSIVLSSNGRVMTECTPWVKEYTYNVKLKHYQTKSLEEYILKKFGSRCADNCFNTPYDMDYYWARNEKTSEAIEAYNKLCKKYNIKDES